MKALVADNLSIQRGKFTMGPVSFSVDKGSRFAVLGPTGNGKTIMLETLAGFYDGEYEGRITKNGSVGFVCQDGGLFPHMTIRQNIGYGLGIRRVPKAEINDQVCLVSKRLSISHILDQYPASASGGERQRAALARSLVLKPDILLMDEPFSALDPATRTALYGTIETLHEETGFTMIFVTHNFHEAQRLSDRTVIMIRGKIKADVNSNELFDRRYGREIEDFLEM